MGAVQKADPAARQRAVLLLVVGGVVGCLLIFGLERYRDPLLDWILSEPEESLDRLRLILLLSGFIVSAPLFAFAAYLWPLGGKVIRSQRFPILGQRVIRDTSILEGQAAITCGRGFRGVAVFLGVAGVMSCYVFWRLASAVAIQ